jgi:thiol:disulfide interchange protein DsbD
VSFDAGFKLDLGYFLEHAEVAAPLRVDEAVEPGEVEVAGQVMFQICRDDLGICLRPARIPFTVAFDVVAGAEPGAPPFAAGEAGGALDLGGTAELDLGAGSVAATPSDYDDARSKGMWGFLLLAVGAGLAALLTPCVFPMIPLTVSYFTRHADDRAKSVRMASVYGLSIVVTFTGLGVVMALIVGAAGAQAIAANPWVNLFIALVLIAFGLSLLGLFELRLPSGWLNYANRQGSERSGYVGVARRQCRRSSSWRSPARCPTRRCGRRRGTARRRP